MAAFEAVYVGSIPAGAISEQRRMACRCQTKGVTAMKTKYDWKAELVKYVPDAVVGETKAQEQP